MDMDMALLENRLSNLERDNQALKAEIGQLRLQEGELQRLKDVEDIKRLTGAYAFYLEHIMWNELADLWCDGPEAELLWVGSGTYKGKETIRKLWSLLPGAAGVGTRELLHMGMRLNPVIDVAPDGLTAQGRWNTLGVGLLPVGENRRVSHIAGIGIDETDYVKENGIWKFKIMRHGEIVGWDVAVMCPPDMLATMEDMMTDDHAKAYPWSEKFGPEVPACEYPGGYILPFHYRHPVTGKETSEAAHNAAMPPQTKMVVNM
jgi:hypothetical protein